MSEWTFEQRQHIEDTADEYSLDYNSAYAIADLLGVDEIHDGFITACQDAEYYI